MLPIFREAEFALVPIYKLFEQLTYYAIGFPIAKSFSSNLNTKENMGSQLKKVFTDIFVIVALIRIAIGGFLNLSSIERPVFYKTINVIFIPGGTAILLVSIGLAMKFGKANNYIKESIAVSIIKFILVSYLLNLFNHL